MTVIVNGNLTIIEGKILWTRPAVLCLVRTDVLTDTDVPQLQLQAYLSYGYGRTTTTAMGVPWLWLRAYLGYRYERTMTVATGVRMGELR